MTVKEFSPPLRKGRCEWWAGRMRCKSRGSEQPDHYIILCPEHWLEFDAMIAKHARKKASN